MDFPELSLAPTVDNKSSTNSSSSESETNTFCRKRKFDNHNASVDLQFKDPLPLDWEQCLDLESGKMYYLNRKTARKSWNWPKDQKLDLELNISAYQNQYERSTNSSNGSNKTGSSFGDSNVKKHGSGSSSNMVALACLNCHLLVILSKSAPSCPNCKYVHSLPIFQQSPPPKMPSTVKSLSTLSLLN